MSVTSNLVSLSVIVRDRSGNLVADLSAPDFQVFDDGIEQKVSQFVKEGQPISFVILIDDDVNGREGLEMVQSLRALLAGLSPEDEARICRFDTMFYPDDGFASDQETLLTEIKAAQSRINPAPKYVPEPARACAPTATGPPCLPAPAYAGSRPTKALDDAIFSAAELLQAVNRSRRKVILVISDGANEPKLNTHDFGSVREKVLAENISVFGLAAGGHGLKTKSSRLESYSRLSGGDTYYASKSRAIEQLYSRIMEEARHQYILAYSPTGTDVNSSYHHVEVHVARDGLVVLTRQGYYAKLRDEVKH